MDIVDQLKAFVATAQTGSFTAAADQLGTSNRLTSKYVAALETRLGTRLFQRTTRKVGLTPAGEELFARARGLLDDLEELLSDVSEGSRGYAGELRISAPVTFGELYVARMLGRFAAAHPHLNIDLRLSDRYVDLASEGIDLAFRIGVTDTLSIKARKLGSFESVITASPAYLAEFGMPEKPEDLARHICIVDTNRRNPRRWTLFRGSEEMSVTVAGRFHVNSAQAACDLAADGQGIAYSPGFAAAKALENGQLVKLFEDYNTERSPVSAIYLEGRALPRKTRALIDFAAQDIRTARIV